MPCQPPNHQGSTVAAAAELSAYLSPRPPNTCCDIWQVYEGSKSRVLAAVEGGITCFAAHPSGAFLAIGTSSGTVLLYDLRGPDLKYASLLQLQFCCRGCFRVVSPPGLVECYHGEACRHMTFAHFSNTGRIFKLCSCLFAPS